MICGWTACRSSDIATMSSQRHGTLRSPQKNQLGPLPVDTVDKPGQPVNDRPAGHQACSMGPGVHALIDATAAQGSPVQVDSLNLPLKLHNYYRCQVIRRGTAAAKPILAADALIWARGLVLSLRGILLSMHLQTAEILTSRHRSGRSPQVLHLPKSPPREHNVQA